MLSRIASDLKKGWKIERTGEKDENDIEIVNLVSPHTVAETAPGPNFGKQVNVRMRIAPVHIAAMENPADSGE